MSPNALKELQELQGLQDDFLSAIARDDHSLQDVASRLASFELRLTDRSPQVLSLMHKVASDISSMAQCFMDMTSEAEKVENMLEEDVENTFKVLSLDCPEVTLGDGVEGSVAQRTGFHNPAYSQAHSHGRCARIARSEYRHCLSPGYRNTTVKRPANPSYSTVSVDAILGDWLLEHIHNPYPSSSEKTSLSKQCGITVQEVCDWLINARRKIGWVSITKRHFLGRRPCMVQCLEHVLLRRPGFSKYSEQIVQNVQEMKAAAIRIYRGSEFVQQLGSAGPEEEDLDKIGSSDIALEPSRRPSTVVGSRKRGRDVSDACAENLETHGSISRKRIRRIGEHDNDDRMPVLSAIKPTCTSSHQGDAQTASSIASLTSCTTSQSSSSPHTPFSSPRDRPLNLSHDFDRLSEWIADVDTAISFSPYGTSPSSDPIEKRISSKHRAPEDCESVDGDKRKQDRLQTLPTEQNVVNSCLPVSDVSDGVAATQGDHEISDNVVPPASRSHAEKSPESNSLDVQDFNVNVFGTDESFYDILSTISFDVPAPSEWNLSMPEAIIDASTFQFPPLENDVLGRLSSPFSIDPNLISGSLPKAPETSVEDNRNDLHSAFDTTATNARSLMDSWQNLQVQSNTSLDSSRESSCGEFISEDSTRTMRWTANQPESKSARAVTSIGFDLSLCQSSGFTEYDVPLMLSGFEKPSPVSGPPRSTESDAMGICQLDPLSLLFAETQQLPWEVT